METKPIVLADRRGQRIAIFVLVAIFHLVALRLLASMQTIEQHGRQPPLEFVLIALPDATRADGLQTGENPSNHAPLVAIQPMAPRPIRAPTAGNPPEIEGAPTPPTDWYAELDRAARDQAAEQPSRADFGFPHRAAPSPKTPEFGWDYVHLHRVQSIPGGGVLVNLNDNCVLVFFPLPFIGCGIGKKPANGDLFESMRAAPP